MYKIVRRRNLNDCVTLFEVDAPEVAKAFKPGQFAILRVDEAGERFPLTIAAADPARGTVTIVFQIVGKSTRKLNALQEGDQILDFAGPLGKPSDLDGLREVCLVVGGVGSAAGYPLAKALHDEGATVDAVAGFRTRDLIILDEEYREVSKLYLVTDDGSAGEKGLVTDRLAKLLDEKKYDLVIAVGPLAMMQAVAKLTRARDQRTVVSMNPIMIDGTGMCGGCRVTYYGEVKFACVDGPEFDAFGIDFDEAILRSKMYRREEREEDCRLL
ncbi:MAG: sulfide/dihydroorotate dehydrogenase-like FAD/NAD-binding protein [Bacilli bacterium]|jgi:ferredoxin--NADP+ reductase|nr:sulfide/dihydroorotate dehydrogenase-like FAD/NAD-binding protein [Acholeplasmataceae bacterium]